MFPKLFALPLKGLLWLLGHTPWPILKILSRLLYCFLFYFPGYRRDVVMLNMLYTLPDHQGEQLRKAQKDFYLHLSELVFEIIKGFFMRPEEMKARIELSKASQEMFDRWEKDQRNVVMLMGHYGNWEWANLYGCISNKLHSYGAYTPMSNKVWNQYFLEKRQRWNGKMFSNREIREGILLKGEPGKLIGLVADQSPTGRKHTHEVRFLGMETRFFSGPDFISEMLQADVVYVQMKKLGMGRYSLYFIPIGDVSKGFDPAAVPGHYASLLEQDIKEHPEWWVWTHKRWKGLIPY